jgi:hypothetical protein
MFLLFLKIFPLHAKKWAAPPLKARLPALRGALRLSLICWFKAKLPHPMPLVKAWAMFMHAFKSLLYISPHFGHLNPFH